jgi:hypothetical protein
VIGAAHGDDEVEWRRHGIHPGVHRDFKRPQA